jgi:hypothetical protein
MLQKAASEHPGSLADWLLGWVEEQQRMGTSSTFDISEIPIPVDLDRVIPTLPPAPEVFSPPQLTPAERVVAQREARVARKKTQDELLEKVGYKELPLPQRKAIRKFLGAGIETVEETERLPDSEECWLGDHKMEGWEDDDFYLWIVVGIWSGDKGFRKWGCAACAQAVLKTHPEAQAHG